MCECCYMAQVIHFVWGVKKDYKLAGNFKCLWMSSAHAINHFYFECVSVGVHHLIDHWDYLSHCKLN